MSAQLPKSLSSHSGQMNSSTFLTPLPEATRVRFQHQIPHSVHHGGNSCWPSCVNHKRRRTTHVVTLEEGEILNFCKKCMDMAEIQGFNGIRIEEFHRSVGQTFKKHS